jgi:hypothetical protein
MRAVDYLTRDKGIVVAVEDVKKAMELHDSCRTCKGAGGGAWPERPCPECGLTLFDSLGLVHALRPTVLGVLVLTVVASGCPTTAVQGTTEVKAQSEYTLNTQSPCVRAKEAIAVADMAWMLTREALQSAGLIKFKDPSGIPMVCLIEQPEPCCVNGYCVGPYKESDVPGRPGAKILTARKAGCSSNGFAWATLKWPPVCTDAWLDEPHCVESWAEQSLCGWEERLRHEVFNMGVLRWTGLRDPEYKTRVYTEIEPEVSRRFFAALIAADYPGELQCPLN